MSTAPPPSEPPSRPWLERRRLWLAGRLVLAFVAALALAALWRPISGSPSLAAASLFAIAVAVVASASLASLRGHGPAARAALFASLALAIDAVGQRLGAGALVTQPLGLLLVAALAVAEPWPWPLAIALLQSAFYVADALRPGGPDDTNAWVLAAATLIGQAAVVLAIDRALVREKRRLAQTLARLTSLETGIDRLAPQGGERPNPVVRALQDVSGEGRRVRLAERTHERDDFLKRLVGLARQAARAHAVAYFDIDPERDVAAMVVADGPPGLESRCLVPLNRDPFGFVLQRRQSFYATDYKRLLWELPYYQQETRIGTLLAVPVRQGEKIVGVLIADQLETQALNGDERELLQAFADLAAELEQRLRAMIGREEAGLEFAAIYGALQGLKTLQSPRPVYEFLLRAAQQLVPLEAAAVVRAHNDRYVIEAGVGWAHEYEGHEVATDARTWTAWVLRSAQGSQWLADLAGESERMPVLALHEGVGRAGSLLALPLRVEQAERELGLGALMITGRAGSFSTQSQRILEVLAQQAATVLRIHQLTDSERRRALEDALTGLKNRRAFDSELQRALAQAGRSLKPVALVLVDIDHFKRLNDSYGHPAGDAALKRVGHALKGALRGGDVAARYGGEEFALILPDAEQAAAQQTAERLRATLESDVISFEGARLKLTASLGLALYPADGGDVTTLLASADRALYAAKQAGRNQVVTASSLPPPEAPPGTADESA